MASFSYSIDIGRPPADVYAYATDPLRFPKWQPDVAGARLVGEGPARLGSRFETTRRIAGRDQNLTQDLRGRSGQIVDWRLTSGIDSARRR